MAMYEETYSAESWETETPETDPCASVDKQQSQFILYLLPAACCIVALLSLLTTRKNLWQSCLGGRPGMLYPINFLDERSRRWAYVVVFAMMAYNVLNLFDEDYFWKPEKYNDEAWTRKFAWTKVFLGLINIVIMGLVYYPLLVCISLRRFLVANIVGIIYMGPWMYIHINTWVVCPMTKGEIALLRALFEAPMLLYLVILLVAYILDLVKNVRCLWAKKQYFTIKNLLHSVPTDDTKVLLPGESFDHCHDSLAVTYVKEMLKRKPLPEPSTWRERLKRRLTYNTIPGYKYPPRMMCIVIVAIMALYKMAVYVGIKVYMLLDSYKSDFEVDSTSSNGTALLDLVKVCQYSFMASNITSLVLHVLFMFHILVSHRSHITSLYRGDRTWHFQLTSSPAERMVASMRYSGYQIAFLINGYGVLLLVLFAVSTAISYLLILPLVNNTSSVLIDFIKDFWPTVLVAIFIYVVQLLWAKFFFLQERGRYIALENRRVYHMTTFFLFFFNVLLGLFSCLKRIILSMVFGTLLISRLDRCLLMRGFERFDKGFKAYIGMCEVDLYHTHPVLVAFAEVMTGVAALASEERAIASEERVVEMIAKQTQRQRIRNKWWKCVTLLNNPTIVIERMHERVKKKRRIEEEVGTIAVDQLGNLATGIAAGVVISGVTHVDDVTADVSIF